MTLNELPVIASGLRNSIRPSIENPSTAPMTPGSLEVECAFTEQHWFSADAGNYFLSGTAAQAYWTARPLSLPERAVYRQLYFAAWFDGLSAVQLAGEVAFSLRGAEVMVLPLKFRREAATLANTFGSSLCPFEVWGLDPADTDFVVPSSGQLLPDSLVLADTGATKRYLTSLAPRRFSLTADRCAFRITDWQVPVEASASGFIHIGVQSQTRPL
jgi:hypothetical protein